MITAYSWAAGILFQNELPSSITDVYKRAMLVNEINTPLIQGKNIPSHASLLLLMDLDDNEKSQRLDHMVQISAPYLTEDIEDKVRMNILLRLWTGCTEAAKTISANYLAGIKSGQVIEAPITVEYRRMLFNLIDLLARTDPIFKGGMEAAPSLKKILKEHYSFNGVPANSVVRRYTNEYQRD